MITQGRPVKKEFTIIVADRNHHVREYLLRELVADGYVVRTAENFRQVLKLAFHPDAPDLLILDPNLPDADESGLPDKLRNLDKHIPVVIHTFLSEYNENYESFGKTVFVEKNGNSILRLKLVVAELLKML